MCKSPLALVAMVLVATMGLALAEEKIGMLTSLDVPRDELTVENVTAKIQGAKIEGDDINAFKTGDLVMITFDQKLDSFILQTLDRLEATPPK